mmetsp:Transcript_14517/g.25462  ORF Transcript_14517/g.25462 Transcript_14517/m.25462 type:complete len:200 (-) Transcript_14517:124-723(-)
MSRRRCRSGAEAAGGPWVGCASGRRSAAHSTPCSGSRRRPAIEGRRPPARPTAPSPPRASRCSCWPASCSPSSCWFGVGGRRACPRARTPSSRCRARARARRAPPPHQPTSSRPGRWSGLPPTRTPPDPSPSAFPSSSRTSGRATLLELCYECPQCRRPLSSGGHRSSCLEESAGAPLASIGPPSLAPSTSCAKTSCSE